MVWSCEPTCQITVSHGQGKRTMPETAINIYNNIADSIMETSGFPLSPVITALD